MTEDTRVDLDKEGRERVKGLLLQGEQHRYDPRYVRHFGSDAAIFLSQLVWRDGTGIDPSGWIYKPEREWTEETGLSRRRQRNARNILTKKGVLEERRGLQPGSRRPVNFYKLNGVRLLNILDPGLAEREGLSECDTGLTSEDGTTVPASEDGSIDLAREDGITDPASEDGTTDLDKQKNTQQSTAIDVSEENFKCVAADAATAHEDLHFARAGDADHDHDTDQAGDALRAHEGEGVAENNELPAAEPAREPDRETDDEFAARLVAALDVELRERHDNRLWPGQRIGYERQAHALLATHDRERVEAAFEHIATRWSKCKYPPLQQALEEAFAQRDRPAAERVEPRGRRIERWLDPDEPEDDETSRLLEAERLFIDLWWRTELDGDRDEHLRRDSDGGVRVRSGEGEWLKLPLSWVPDSFKDNVARLRVWNGDDGGDPDPPPSDPSAEHPIACECIDCAARRPRYATPFEGVA